MHKLYDHCINESWYDNEFKFKGILKGINLNDLSKIEVSDLFISLGIFEKSYKYNELRYKYYVKSKELMDEILFRMHIEFVSSILESDQLPSEYQVIMQELNFKISINDKISHLQLKINEILNELGKSENYYLFGLYSLNNSPRESPLSFWYYHISENLVFVDDVEKYWHMKDGEIRVEETVMNFLHGRLFTSQSGIYTAYDVWKKLEGFIIRLELYKIMQQELIDVLNKNDTYNYNYKLSKDKSTAWNKDLMFLQELNKYLIDKEKITVLTEIFELNEVRNIPFYTAFYKYFSGSEGKDKMLFVNFKQKTFIDIVNNYYNLNMTRLITETGVRPGYLRDIFKLKNI